MPHAQSHATIGGGAFFGMDDLDPIAIHVLFEEWDSQTESSQDDQAAVCALGRLFVAIRLGLDCHSLGTQEIVNSHGFAWCPSWGSWAEEDL